MTETIVYSNFKVEVEVELEARNIKLISSLITMKMKTFVIYKTFVRCIFWICSYFSRCSSRLLYPPHFSSQFQIGPVQFCSSCVRSVFGDNFAHSFNAVFTFEHKCTETSAKFFQTNKTQVLSFYRLYMHFKRNAT